MKSSLFSLRTLLATALLAGSSQLAWSQGLGIGTATPDASAIVEMQATNKGMLAPRVALTSLTDATTITAPATALLVFNTNAALTGGKGFYYNAAATGATPAWTKLNTGAVAGDNLGNGVATTDVNLGSHALVGTTYSLGTTVGVGVRADGGLNIGENNGQNLFLGYQAGNINSSGINNLYMGTKSGQAGSSASFNLFLGTESGFSNTADGNMFMGFQAGKANTTGTLNQFMGYQSGKANTTGANNQFIGYKSGFASNGGGNVFIGSQSGLSNLSGDGNTFIGYLSGVANTAGSSNMGIGYLAGPTTGNLTNASAIGYNAQVSQSNSLVLGGTGANAVSVGIGTTAPRGVLDVVTDGDLYLVGDISAPNNNKKIFLPGKLIIGTEDIGFLEEYATIQPALNSSASGSAGLRFGVTKNGSAAAGMILNPNGVLDVSGSVYSAGGYTSSDQRLKQNIRPLGGALAALGQLRGVRYQYRQNIPNVPLPKGEQVGFIAQEVEKLYPELVTTAPNGYKAVNYAQLTPVLLEAIKEQQGLIEKQQQQLDALKGQVSTASQRADRAAQAEASQTADIQSLKTQLARLLGEAPAGPVARH